MPSLHRGTVVLSVLIALLALAGEADALPTAADLPGPEYGLSLSGDTVVVSDTVVRGDTVLGGDTLTFPDPEVATPTGPTIPGDTIDLIPVPELVVDILRAPMQMGEAPFAISRIGNEVWATGRSQSSIEEALQGLPGVQIHNRFNDAVGERISIRGYGARSQFGVRGVKIVVDGIPATLPDGQSTLDHLDLGSLGQVEALRGPGSAMYGNAAGGVLTFETRPPAQAPLRQEFRVIQGDHDYQRRQSTTSGQVGEVDYFLNLARYEFGGFRSDPLGAPGETYGGAVRDHLNAQASAPLLDGRLRLIANAMELDAENPGALARHDLAYGDRRALSHNVQQQARKDARQRQGSLTWEGPLGDRELHLMAYGIRRDIVEPGVADWVELDRFAGGFRAAVRSEFVGEEGRLWWSLGMDADLQRDHRLTYENLDGLRGLRTMDQRERVSAGAVFIQAMLPINQMLDVLTGLRYDRIRFSAHDRFPGAPGQEADSGARTLDSASPSFGFHAGFHDALGLYVNLTTAFETPTANELSTRPDGGRGFNPELEPQVGITTEVGGRGVLGSTLAWEAVFFHTTLHNELVPFELADTPGRRYFQNSGRSQREGWELSLQFAPDPLVSTRVVLSTNNARFRAFEAEGEDYSGNRVPGLAPRRAEAILRVGPGRWFAELRGEATAAIPGDNNNTPQAESPPYRLLDFRAGANEVNILGLRLSPFFGVTNLLDVEYNTSVVANALEGRHFEPGPGRSFYAGSSVAVQF